jgi:hypothetical protein
MAENSFNNITKVDTIAATGAMIKDLEDQLLKDGQYSHALNAQKQSHLGDLLFIENEPSNFKCLTLPRKYQMIGSIKLTDNRFVIFSTDNTSSEIGLFNIKTCAYSTIANNSCLNFNTANLIKGVFKTNSDCSESIYWCDNRNPNRFLNLENIPYTYSYLTDECKTKVYTTTLDCEELNIDSIVTTPILEVSKSNTPGKLVNGSYQASLVYSIKGQNVTNYYSTTIPQPLFSSEIRNSALEINIKNLDIDFDEFKIYVIATVAQQTTVYEIGTYNINTSKVTVTNIDDKITVPYSDLFLQKVVYEKSKNVIESSNSLIWLSATTVPELNYQSQSLKIQSEWVGYRVPRNYYRKGGNKAFYMRDEVYGFAIQWYNKKGGFWTPAYHIPGRPIKDSDKKIITNDDAYELHNTTCEPKSKVYAWEIYDTSTGGVNLKVGDLCDEYEVGKGSMSYYESKELYPDNESLFGDLKCKPVRHHKMPSEEKIPRTSDDDKNGMILLGVRFKNIEHPRDKNGKLLTEYSSYRIVRTDRKGNKSIIGKGLLYNTALYSLPVSNTNKINALYPNYPFNDLRIDPFLSKKEVTTKANGVDEKNYKEMGDYKRDIFTFHSPSFSFAKPSFGNELKIESLSYGNTQTIFTEVYGHPKHKIVTTFAFVSALLMGLGESILATNEKKCETIVAESFNPGNVGTVNGIGNPAILTAMNAYTASLKLLESTPEPAKTTGTIAAKNTFIAASQLALSVPGAGGNVSITQQKCQDAYSKIPLVLKTLNQFALFSFYFQQGVDTALNFINAFTEYEQYALQVNSYCNYDKQKNAIEGSKRRFIQNANYLYPVMQDFEGLRINNFKRESSVILKINKDILDPSIQDTSRNTISSANLCDSNKAYEATASSYYASIRVPQYSQYGQIDSIKYLDTGSIHLANGAKTYISNIIFGGDTFLNRFTLKRKMSYFNQTEFNELDGHSFDYTKYYNIPYARYWIDTFKYDLNDLISLTNPELPTDKHNLDCKKKLTKSLKTPFIKRNNPFYLYNSGIVDFYVESEYNIDLREIETDINLKHYDNEQYTDIDTLLRSDVQLFDNSYRFDKSFLKELDENYIQPQSRYYDENKANTCYSKYDSRVFWTLPYFKEQIKDSWRFNLPNNYYDFSSSLGNLIGMKSLDESNIVFLFDKSAPYWHEAVDALETDSGAKIQIGDGGLFAREPFPLSVTDINYGSCTSSNCIVNTQYGLLYISENQGKIFLLNGKTINEISLEGMSMWFRRNMPLNLLKSFPNYLHKDNTIKGIGFIAGFDNSIDTLYISKKDYLLKEQYSETVTYSEDTDTFVYTTKTTAPRTIKLGDPVFFEDASWNISFNPKLKGWISFHDWHPNIIMQSEDTMLSILTPLKEATTFWVHNKTCSSFCKYYDTQYSFEIEEVLNSGQNTSVLKSIEYSMEGYDYSTNCTDKNHILDYNFSHAIIHNTEQISGLLKLNIRLKNKISDTFSYPKIDSTNQIIDIICTKEEQKYRFNQFWDIVNDRGEFTNLSVPLFVTKANGYSRDINPIAVDYNKPPLQRKRFRHNFQKVYLKKIVENENMKKIIFKFLNNKSNISFR